MDLIKPIKIIAYVLYVITLIITLISFTCGGILFAIVKIGEALGV